MPSNLLKTQSTLRYNCSLKKASSDMKLGVNKSVNLEIKSVEVEQMDWSSSKINRPIFLPSDKLMRLHLRFRRRKKSLNKDKVVRSPSSSLYGLSFSESETNHDMAKVRLISTGLVSAFLIHRLFF